MGRDRRAFTLIEMLAVLVIIALMAGIGVASLRSQRQLATLDAMTSAVCDYDRCARLYAERSQSPVQMQIDSGQVQLDVVKHPDQTLRWPLVLADGFAIKDCWVAGGVMSDDLTVLIGPQGRSRTYGFCLSAPDGKKRWIFVSGLTGQLQILEDDAQSTTIMQMLSKKRLDPS